MDDQQPQEQREDDHPPQVFHHRQVRMCPWSGYLCVPLPLSSYILHIFGHNVLSWCGSLNCDILNINDREAFNNNELWHLDNSHIAQDGVRRHTTTIDISISIYLSRSILETQHSWCGFIRYKTNHKHCITICIVFLNFFNISNFSFNLLHCPAYKQNTL